MAHQIETFTNGKAAFFSAREDAWHRLGTVTSSAQTAEQALETALLANWNVRKVGLATEAGSAVNDHWATVRTNPATNAEDVLGVVGRKYHPIQNEAHAELLNALVDLSGAHFETAGSLKGGREVFVTMKMPQGMSVGGVDDVDLYIAALNSHDGSTSFRILVTPVRIVCANTQAAALRQAKSSFAIRHTRGSRAAIALARHALGLTHDYQAAFEAEAEAMIQQHMTTSTFMSMVKKIFPEPADSSPALAQRRYQDKVEELERLFAEAATNENIRDTAWAGYQAVTEYIDHFAPAQRTKWAADESTARAIRALGPQAVKLKEQTHRLFTSALV